MYEEVGMKRLMGIFKWNTNKGAIASNKILIGAPDGPCFRNIATQLEHPVEWDSIILHIWPVSSMRIQAGATSYAFVNFLGKKFHALATVSDYKPKHTVNWALSGDYEMRIYWQLEPKGAGTLVNITLAWQSHNWLGDFSLCRTLQRKRVERLLWRMLVRLKNTVEKEEAAQIAEKMVAPYFVEGKLS